MLRVAVSCLLLAVLAVFPPPSVASDCYLKQVVHDANDAVWEVTQHDLIKDFVRHGGARIKSTHEFDDFVCQLPEVTSVEDIADMLGAPRMAVVTSYDEFQGLGVPQKVNDAVDVLAYIIPDMLRWGFPEFPLLECYHHFLEAADDWVAVLGSDFLEKLSAVYYLGAPPGYADEARNVTGKEMAKVLMSPDYTTFVSRLAEVSGFNDQHLERLFRSVKYAARQLDLDKVPAMLGKVQDLVVLARSLGLDNLPYDEDNIRQPGDYVYRDSDMNYTDYGDHYGNMNYTNYSDHYGNMNYTNYGY